MYPRTQTQIYDSLRYRSRDTLSRRWNDTEVYASINDALDKWANRVMVPHIYSLDWATNTREYTLPAYIRRPIDPQYSYTGGETTWCDFVAYNLRPSGNGSLVLSMDFYPTPGTGRIVFWVPNPPLPVTAPVLQEAIESDATELTLDENLLCGDVGYIKIEDEWIGYAGITYGASTTTLTNLERGAFDTTPDDHDEDVTVEWGVVAHRMDLFSQLEHQALALLHELPLTNAAAHEQETHERQLQLHMQMADSFWRTYVPLRKPKQILSSSVIGDPLYSGRRGYQHLSDRSYHR